MTYWDGNQRFPPSTQIHRSTVQDCLWPLHSLLYRIHLLMNLPCIGGWPRLIVLLVGLKERETIVTPPPLIFIFSSWPLNPEQWVAAAAAGGNNGSVRSAVGGWDDAELQMDADKRGELQSSNRPELSTTSPRVGGPDPDPQGSWFLLVATQSSQLWSQHMHSTMCSSKQGMTSIRRRNASRWFGGFSHRDHTAWISFVYPKDTSWSTDRWFELKINKIFWPKHLKNQIYSRSKAGSSDLSNKRNLLFYVHSSKQQ